MHPLAPAHHRASYARSHRVLPAVLALALAAALATPAAAATYYVDNQSPTCSNVGAGTEAEPYCSIAAAVAAHSGPGNTIIVNPGTYREQVTIPASGASGTPFVIQAAGPGTVIDGADLFDAESLWVQMEAQVVPGGHLRLAVDNPWLAASVTWAPQQVFVDGRRLIPSTATPATLPANSFTWVAGEGLYVNLDGTNPGLHQTLVGHRKYGFSMYTKSWVTIDGFEIIRTEERGINMQAGCSDVVVARNRVSFSRSYGIQGVGGINLVIEDNVVSDCGYHGIGLIAGSTACIVRNNESFRNVDPNIRRANGIYLHGSTGTTLYGNRLHHNQDSGVQFNGGANNSLAYNNRSWNNGDHGYDHLDATGTIHVNDIAFGNYKDGFSIEGNAPYTRLHNCIGVDNGLNTDEFNLWVNDSSAVGFVSDHNIFWNSTAQEPIKYITTKYVNLADYQAASGQDAHSHQADPRFVNGPAGDFALLAGSPAIDAGTTSVSGYPATDAVGQVRLDDPFTANAGAGTVLYADIGALEYIPAGDLGPVVTAPGTIMRAPGATVSFTVTVSDPDGQAIQSLVMVPVKMPANSGATFVPNATNTAGTFTWTMPNITGDYRVRFVATNTLVGSADTNIKARWGAPSDGQPAVQEIAGNEPALEGTIARELAFSSAFPNPTRGAVEFALDAPRETRVRWAVFDVQGRTVWSEERDVAAGRTQLRWDGETSARGQAPGGVYVVQAVVDGTRFSRRVVRF